MSRRSEDEKVRVFARVGWRRFRMVKRNLNVNGTNTRAETVYQKGFRSPKDPLFLVVYKRGNIVKGQVSRN